MSRVALLGGSFNPPHVGHQMIALWVLSTGRADQVWLIPCFRHPFGKPLAPFEQRERMCQLAAGALVDGRVLTSPVERELGGEGRTLVTIEHLLQAHPEHELSLVIGADILAERDAWYRFDRIEELVEIVVIGRQGYPSPPGTIELPNVSSSEIRALLAAGGDASALVPAEVLGYIRRQGLYGAPGS